MSDHDLRPECAKEFGTMHAEIRALANNAKERREEYRDLRTLIGAVREDISALQVRARGWGAIGGLFAALVTLGIAAAVAAFSG